MVAFVSQALMSDGTPFPFSPLFDVTVEDGRVFTDLTPPQLQQLAAREGWQLQRA